MQGAHRHSLEETQQSENRTPERLQYNRSMEEVCCTSTGVREVGTLLKVWPPHHPPFIEASCLLGKKPSKGNRNPAGGEFNHVISNV